MSDTWRLRDPSQPCEHDEAFRESPDYPWVCRLGSIKYPECPGGKLVELEVAAAIMTGSWLCKTCGSTHDADSCEDPQFDYINLWRVKQ